MKELEDFFENRLIPGEGFTEKQLYEIRYAAAALLIACSKSDFEEDPDEEDVIVELLQKHFDVDEALLDELIGVADRMTSSASLEFFTDLVNKYYNQDAKLVLVEDLWRVAFADGRIDQYEDLFIGKVAGLISVDPEQVLALKSAVE